MIIKILAQAIAMCALLAGIGCWLTRKEKQKDEAGRLNVEAAADEDEDDDGPLLTWEDDPETGGWIAWLSKSTALQLFFVDGEDLFLYSKHTSDEKGSLGHLLGHYTEKDFGDYEDPIATLKEHLETIALIFTNAALERYL